MQVWFKFLDGSGGYLSDITNLGSRPISESTGFPPQTVTTTIGDTFQPQNFTTKDSAAMAAAEAGASSLYRIDIHSFEIRS